MSKETRVIAGNEKYVEAENSIREQAIVAAILTETEVAKRTLLNSAIIIGKNLTEAKTLVKHGEWENWLKERINYSVRNARKFMQVFKEYGNNEIDHSNVYSSLGYSQAIELLAVPSEEREKFAEEIGAKDLTITELREQIQAMKDGKAAADAEIEKLKAEQDAAAREKDNLNKDIEMLSERIEQLKQEQQAAQEKQDEELAKRLEGSIQKEQKKITDLEAEKEKLSQQLKNLQAAKEQAVAKARAEEKANAAKALDKKDRELETARKNFNRQINDLKQKNEEEKGKVKDAEKRAALSKELVKCEVLLNNIESAYENLLDSLKKIQKTYPDQMIEVEKSLGKVLKTMERRSKLHVVS